MLVTDSVAEPEARRFVDRLRPEDVCVVVAVDEPKFDLETVDTSVNEAKSDWVLDRYMLPVNASVNASDSVRRVSENVDVMDTVCVIVVSGDIVGLSAVDVKLRLSATDTVPDTVSEMCRVLVEVEERVA
eukprot:PhM_4_TR8385/c1_g2_i5/m.11958